MQDKTVIALCGRPGSGKSEVQRILHEHFGIIPFDDAEIGRRHCMELFDMSLHDVTTQEGKSSTTVIQGRDWENRKVIGEYLKAVEDVFGDLVVPHWALRSAKRQHPHAVGYSFGSVRLGQSRAYAQVGGFVVEIVRPGVERSGNIWDDYDRRWITHTFLNSTEDLVEMEAAVCSFFKDLLITRQKEEAA